MESKTHIIDAANKAFGRVATQVASLLRGKQKPSFVPYKDIGDFVIVKNINKTKLSGKKFEKKIYYHHTGYLGGLKATPLKKIFQKDPAKVFRKMVLGMMPRNKLRARQIKRLKIE